MKRILANDGIDKLGKKLLEEAGFFVETTKAAEGQLAETINAGNFDTLLVRSATKVNSSVMDACPNLKLIGRAGVGLDNIDVKYAETKGIKVINTPAASSQSVAELVFAHLFSGVRFLQEANHAMRTQGESKFNDLKKSYAAGIELQGKTIGIIGFGRIGQAVGKMAVGLGMNVIASDPFIKEATLKLYIVPTKQDIDVKISTVPMEEVLINSDFISLHVPGKINGKALIGGKELDMMKPGSAIVNAARGGVVDEDALLHALDTGHIAFAGLDVFENEPTPATALMHHPKISLSPHIGASTAEAQERIGKEMAEGIIAFYS
jgi:D-3-phosphoglycerate dehydrogenase / 2-oxoglutarate reductase